MSAPAVPRKCSLCKRSPREDDPMSAAIVRLKAADIEAAGPRLPRAASQAEPGLYQLCADCMEAVQPVVDERLVAEGVAADLASITAHQRM